LAERSAERAGADARVLAHNGPVGRRDRGHRVQPDGRQGHVAHGERAGGERRQARATASSSDWPSWP